MNPQTELLAAILAKYLDKPVTFNERVLGRPPYWSRQCEIARSVRDNKATVVVTGNSVGKSYLAAGLILWWLFTRPNSLVVTTAPSQTLLGTVLFKEIRNAVSSSRLRGVPLPCSITDSASASPQVCCVEGDWQVLGISTRGVERLSGQHNPNLFVLVDEASGVLPGVWESLISLNPKAWVIFGNPLSGANEFERRFRQGMLDETDASIPPERRTKSIRIPSTDSPDIHLERSSRGLADLGFLQEAERIWGKGTLLWRSHVEAAFPEKSAFALIEPDWIDRSLLLPQQAPSGRRILSVDIAAGVGADRTVILVRDANSVLYLSASKYEGLAAAAAKTSLVARQFGINEDAIVYDASGPGRDFPKHTAQHAIRNPIPYAGSATGHNRSGLSFTNLRASSAWKLKLRLDPDQPPKPDPSLPDPRDLAPHELARLRQIQSQPQAGFALPTNVIGSHANSLREELVNLRYVPGLRIGLEPKAELTARIGRSPDLADALIMSFAHD